MYSQKLNFRKLLHKSEPLDLICVIILWLAYLHFACTHWTFLILFFWECSRTRKVVNELGINRLKGNTYVRREGEILNNLFNWMVVSWIDVTCSRRKMKFGNGHFIHVFIRAIVLFQWNSPRKVFYRCTKDYYVLLLSYFF